MLKRITIGLLTVFCATVTSAQSQKEWSLEQCISYALTNNIQLKQQQLNVSQNENNLLQSKLDLAPDVSGSSSYGLSWGRAFDQASISYVDRMNTTASAGIRASLTLFSGFQKQNTIKRNSIELQAAIQDVEKLKNDMSLNIAGAYLQILLDKEGVQVAQKQLETTTEQMKKTKVLVDAGSLTIGSYLELQAQQATEETQLVVAQNKLTVSYLNLKQLLDLQADNTFRVSEPTIAEPPTVREAQNVNRMFEQNAELRPEVKSAELRLKSAEKALSIAKGADYPSLSIGGSLSTFYSDAPTPSGADASKLSQQFKDNLSYPLSASLSIPIFNGWQTRTNVRNSKLSVRNAELQVQSIKNTLYKEIQQAEVDAEAALKRYHASQKNVTALQESFRYVEQKFNVGMVSTTDYNVAKNNLTRSQSEQIQSKYQFIFQTKILDFYMGIPLTL